MLDDPRLAALAQAEDRALALFDSILSAGIIRPGRTEQEIERDIGEIAAGRFGVERHWHKRIVRAGSNTLASAGESPPDLIVGEQDIVFVDLGPVFGEWEADVGRSFVVGDDPSHHALVAALPCQFAALRSHLLAHPEISGAELYVAACQNAEAAGWRFGGAIAGHIVAEFPHARLTVPRRAHAIGPDNPRPLAELDVEGRPRHWIGEIHLIALDGSFGGFYEQLLLRPSSQFRAATTSFRIASNSTALGKP
ncbi:M24 family metallopeptidase [Sphingobium tyrosinilyticum]|uniref:M24 family metallopeptidase n=1 Tax=Sphingobium tyrosinilyticum TaxID=2715436 RepID=A0ABV9F3Q2_9SPHN